VGTRVWYVLNIRDVTFKMVGKRVAVLSDSFKKEYLMLWPLLGFCHTFGLWLSALANLMDETKQMSFILVYQHRQMRCLLSLFTLNICFYPQQRSFKYYDLKSFGFIGLRL